MVIIPWFQTWTCARNSAQRLWQKFPCATCVRSHNLRRFALGSFQIAATLPLGAFDRQRVLATDSSAARCALVGRLCAERAGDLQALLAMGSGEPDAGSGPDPI